MVQSGTLSHLFRIIVRVNAPPAKFTYNAAGNYGTMLDVTGTTTYSYDKRDRSLSKAPTDGTLRDTSEATGGERRQV